MPNPTISPAMTLAGVEVFERCMDDGDEQTGEDLPHEEIVQRIYMAMESAREKENG